jgi:hypothetical protein
VPIVPLFLRRLQLSLFQLIGSSQRPLEKAMIYTLVPVWVLWTSAANYSGPVPDEEFDDKAACEHAIQGANLVPPFRGRKSGRMGR